MADRTYEVYTDLDPDALTDVAALVYRAWLAFALGQGEIGGRVLKHPSGRYAASMSWRKTGQAAVAIIADESIAPEAQWIEEGKSSADIKAAMLGKGNTKISKAGYRYRVIPMKRDPTAPAFDASSILTSQAGEHLPVKTARMWARSYSHWDTQHGADRFRTMTDKPGSAPWVVPAMAAYSPAAILADIIRREAGTR
jgi:hypothetical protein